MPINPYIALGVKTANFGGIGDLLNQENLREMIRYRREQEEDMRLKRSETQRALAERDQIQQLVRDLSAAGKTIDADTLVPALYARGLVGPAQKFEQAYSEDFKKRQDTLKVQMENRAKGLDNVGRLLDNVDSEDSYQAVLPQLVSDMQTHAPDLVRGIPRQYGDGAQVGKMKGWAYDSAQRMTRDKDAVEMASKKATTMRDQIQNTLPLILTASSDADLKARLANGVENKSVREMFNLPLAQAQELAKKYLTPDMIRAQTEAAKPEEVKVTVNPDTGKQEYTKLSEAPGKQPGYPPQRPINIGGNQPKPRLVLAKDAGTIAEMNTGLTLTDRLFENLLGRNMTTGQKTGAGGKTGPGPQVGAATPGIVTGVTGWGQDAKSTNANIALVRQIIGKGLEGGVLRKEDEYKYKEILPVIGDTPVIVRNKLRKLSETLKTKREEFISSLEDASFDVSKYRARIGAGAQPTTPTQTAPAQTGGGTYRPRYEDFISEGLEQ